MSVEAETEIPAILGRLGFAPEPGEPIKPLAGGVSCDIFRVELVDGPVCVKRALPKLRVASDWRAPVERVWSEVKWLKLAERLGRPRAPHVRAESKADHLFVMDYLDHRTHANWKVELAEGRVDPAFAAEVGRDIAFIHAATAGDREIARAFATGEMFHALRLEPYLLHAARRHPDLAGRLTQLATATGDARIALVHGDVSPKNILVGPEGPVFLDAECAWYGDPAFDLAFCLTHLLLKCVWRPAHRELYLAAFDALLDAYMEGVDWEPREGFAVRAGALLSAILLARVDGKSPVEYLVAPEDQDFVRRAAAGLVARDAVPVAEVGRHWANLLETR